jgi:hypothetical protein
VVPDANPVIELVKLPVPEPSVVLLSDIVGLLDVLQHTPCAVTEDDPADVTFPPPVAVVEVIFVIEVVIIDGVFCDSVVEKETALPYEVPLELVAYART